MYTHTYTASHKEQKKKSLKDPHRAGEPTEHHTQTFHFQIVGSTPYIFIQYFLVTLGVHVLSRWFIKSKKKRRK